VGAPFGEKQIDETKHEKADSGSVRGGAGCDCARCRSRGAACPSPAIEQLGQTVRNRNARFFSFHNPSANDAGVFRKQQTLQTKKAGMGRVNAGKIEAEIANRFC
jgi:hypothetical protein